jgi:flagellar hook-length control protein FliK
MIVQANSVISGVTPDKVPEKSTTPETGEANFATTLEKAYPTKPVAPAKDNGATQPDTAKRDNARADAEPVPVPVPVPVPLPVLPAELPPADLITDMPQPAPEGQTPETPFVDPQLLALQQIVTQNAAVPAQPAQTTEAPVTPAPVQSEAAVQVTQRQERPGTVLMMPESMKPKAVSQAALAAQASLAGKQGTDKTSADQHKDFLSVMTKTDAAPKEPAAAPARFELNPALPVRQESSALLTPETGLRPHITAVSELTSAPAPGVTTSPAVINQALGTPAWQQAVGQQLAYFSRNGIHNAELRLHPEELGALQISLRLNNDQAQLHFVTENHQVRAALEAAMPHLRTSLAESGINLGQSSVGADSSSSSWSASAQSDGSSGRGFTEDDGQENAHLTDEMPEISNKTLHYSNGINTFV